jgi:putative endonuclease
MLDFYVYILKCSDGSYYIGHTDNMERRLGQYNAGFCTGYVAKRLPVELVFVEPCASRAEAISAEHQWKKWSRKKKEALIIGGWEAVKQVCKK